MAQININFVTAKNLENRLKRKLIKVLQVLITKQKAPISSTYNIPNVPALNYDL